MAKKKPKIIKTDTLEIGAVFVKEFFIVAFVPDGGAGFFVIGSGGNPTSTSHEDGLMPCVGTERKVAEEQFKRAEQEINFGQYPKGALMLIELRGGKIAKMTKAEGKVFTVQE